MEYENLKKIETTKYILRYVVPFCYTDQEDMSKYKLAYQNLFSSGNWELDSCCENSSDCYDYIFSLYESKDSNCQEKRSTLGSIWKYVGDTTEWGIFEYNEPVWDESGKKVIGSEVQLYAQITDCGIYLLKNGIGLFWYETVCRPRLKTNEKRVSIETLIRFQNLFKEIARPQYRIQKLRVVEKVVQSRHMFLLGTWVKQMISEIGFGGEFFPTRTVIQEEIKCPPYYKEVFQLELPECEDIEKIPDKALLYTYVAVDSEKYSDCTVNELQQMAYYLTMGYNGKYKLDMQTRKQMVQPFHNMIWYADKEGCGEYVFYTKDNESFFTKRKLMRMRNDYFIMYMNLLQQSYSLLKMAQEIASSVTAEHQDYRNGDDNIIAQLENLETKINVFLVKNVYASVSHVSNQDRFYSYVEDALKIEREVESLKKGLSVLEEILRRKKQEISDAKADRMQSAFSILTIVSIFSLVKDGFDFAELFLNGVGLNIARSVIVILVVFLTAFIIYNSKDALQESFGIIKKRRG